MAAVRSKIGGQSVSKVHRRKRDDPRFGSNPSVRIGAEQVEQVRACPGAMERQHGCIGKDFHGLRRRARQGRLPCSGRCPACPLAKPHRSPELERQIETSRKTGPSQEQDHHLRPIQGAGLIRTLETFRIPTAYAQGCFVPCRDDDQSCTEDGPCHAAGPH